MDVFVFLTGYDIENVSKIYFPVPPAALIERNNKTETRKRKSKS